MNLFAYYLRRFTASENIIRTDNCFGHINTVCIVLSLRINIHELINGLNGGSYNGDLIRHIGASWQNDRRYIILSTESTDLVKVYLPDCDLANSTKREICLEAARVIQSLLESGRLPLRYSAGDENAPRTQPISISEDPIYNPEPIIDKEVLEDTFTCNMLVDRIKNCDTICSGEKKIKIIVREDDNKMMVTNVKFDNNILIIDVDDVKMKELSGFTIGDGLYKRLKSSIDDFVINPDLSAYTWSTRPTSNFAGSLGSIRNNNDAESF